MIGEGNMAKVCAGAAAQDLVIAPVLCGGNGKPGDVHLLRTAAAAAADGGSSSVEGDGDGGSSSCGPSSVDAI
jgi:hypothetical protein